MTTLPQGFDATSYATVWRHAALIADPNDATKPSMQNAWFAFGSAWTGMVYRLRAARDFSDDFGRLIAISTAPPDEDLYLQERALFGCIVSALSAVECFYMATHCLAAEVAPQHFRLLEDKDLKGDIPQITDRYVAWAPSDDFTRELKQVSVSSHLCSLTDLRNVLAHRGTLTRQHFLSTVRDVPSTIPSKPKLLHRNLRHGAPLSAETTSTHVQWVSETCSRLVGSFSHFLSRTTSQQ